jgi:hypothetical protein
MSLTVQANERDRNPDDFCRQCGGAIPPSRLIESITAPEHDCSGYYCSQRCEERASASSGPSSSARLAFTPAFEEQEMSEHALKDKSVITLTAREQAILDAIKANEIPAVLEQWQTIRRAGRFVKFEWWVQLSTLARDYSGASVNRAAFKGLVRKGAIVPTKHNGYSAGWMRWEPAPEPEPEDDWLDSFFDGAPKGEDPLLTVLRAATGART